jgi:hypothetical protein
MSLYQSMKNVFMVGFILVFTLNCGSGTSSTSSSSTSSSTSDSFPVSVNVASPFSTSSASSSVSYATSGASSPSYSVFSDYSTTIAAMLSATAYAECSFDPDEFFDAVVNADCYGSSVKYEEHPDALEAAAADGTLPPGDVGIWDATDSSGEACVAAQLNSSLSGIGSRLNGGLQTAAAIQCVMSVNSTSLPVNASEDVVSDMQDMADANSIGVTFSTASITHDNSSGSNEYTYELEFSYDSDADGIDEYDSIQVDLVHVKGSTSSTGRLAVQTDATGSGNNCTSTDQAGVQAASLLYAVDSADQVTLDARDAFFCGAGSTTLASGLVDLTNNCDDTIGLSTDCWSGNAHLLVADYDPDTLEGDYALSWQAGYGDNTTRAFNVHMDAIASGITTGVGYFGYGAAMSSMDARIKGMLCNWAGPEGSASTAFAGGALTFVNAVQMQEISDGGTTVFSATTSNLTYAPIDSSCEYDMATGGFGGSDFLIDLDGDGTVDAHQDIASELLGVTSSGGFAVLPDFTNPTAPSNF